MVDILSVVWRVIYSRNVGWVEIEVGVNLWGGLNIMLLSFDF